MSKNIEFSDQIKPSLDEKEKEKIINLLVSVYDQEYEDVSKLDDTDLQKLLIKRQEQKISDKNNPNKFWIYKGLPDIKYYKTKTSSKAGVLVVVIFVVLLLSLFVIFMLYAFKNHGVI
ncbi:hypothetical protein V2E24_00640 [Mycoplasmopsis ciconiae]|uniref:Uncharacterized protein n=1 Tax=Mycoplasmopsis ciconiae TaxID=561067 RepID=A0ABU7MKP1_9BACT|nr:hypothetical protein [Mycoplasmopsis ciconiae]